MKVGTGLGSRRPAAHSEASNLQSQGFLGYSAEGLAKPTPSPAKQRPFHAEPRQLIVFANSPVKAIPKARKGAGGRAGVGTQEPLASNSGQRMRAAGTTWLQSSRQILETPTAKGRQAGVPHPCGQSQKLIANKEYEHQSLLRQSFPLSRAPGFVTTDVF